MQPIQRPRVILRSLRHAITSILKHRVRIGSSFLVPIYTILSLLTLLILTIVFTVLHQKELMRQSELRSHHRYASTINDIFYEGCNVPAQETTRANASLVMLARNQEVEDVVKSMKSLERHFNQWYKYPWVFLNDEEFTQEFKDEVKRHTQAECLFGHIEEENWDFPQDVKNTWAFKEGIESQGDRGIMYGSMESYHKMCRFYSGFFYKHPLVRQFEWYWRVEPDVEFFCDITYDPFVKMAQSGKKYGFTILIRELFETVPNLFRHTKAFLSKNNIKPKSSWELFVENYRNRWKMSNSEKLNTVYKNMRYTYEVLERAREVILRDTLVKRITFEKNLPISDDSKIPEKQLDALINLATQRSRLPTLQGETMENEDYNLYHFWSNFEIARVDLWDNPVYEAYFQYLESVGGFFTERWGDAPVHSLAVGFLLDFQEVHYFRDIGYQHTTIRHCPANSPNQLKYEAAKDYTPVFDPKFEKFWSKTDPIKDYGVGCRCRCPTSGEDIEDTDDDFLKRWFELVDDNRKEKKQLNIVKQERKVKDKLKKEGII
ncbi:CYFA0S01e05094g1_1 [Cyberlindnera fabianii]|uniref:CYFA0S01e05094g1_1 n=1 Tax=Cyberlindnera fabianii TaxID=36022 RepID=A0A061AH00_CYBFA|nr:CYFA0S01e05094g1_1 [Cyberlindnera fabianii]